MASFEAAKSLQASPREARETSALLGRFFRVLELTRVDEITAENISRFLAQARQAGASPKTLRNFLSRISTFCAFLIGRGELLANPCQRIQLKKPPRRPPAVLTEEQLETLLASARAAGLFPRIAMAAATGCRLSELRTLTWADIDLARRRLIVRKSKSGTWRIVPLSDLALEALAEQTQILAHASVDGFRYVFPKNLARGGQPDRYQDAPSSAWSWCLRMRNLLKSLDGLHNEVLSWRQVGRGFHALRHTFATRLAAADVNLEKIAQWMGHSDIRMTRVYVHLAAGYDGDIEKAAGKATGNRQQATGQETERSVP